MKLLKQYKHVLGFIAAGLLWGLGIILPFGWLLVIIGVALYFNVLIQTTTYRQLFWGSYGSFVIKYVFALWWFTTTYPLEWLGLPPGWYQYLLIGIYLIPAAFTLGTAGAWVAFWYLFFRRRVGQKYCDLLLIPLFVTAEYIGAFVFALYTYGPGASLGPNFTFGFVGYTLAAHKLFLSLVPYGGLVVLSVAVIGIGYVVALLFMRRHYIITVVMFLMLLASSQVALLPVYSSTTDNRVVTMQMLWPRGTPAEYPMLVEQKARQVEAALAAASKLSPTHVIFPEDARLTTHTTHTEMMDTIKSMFPTAVVIDSGRVEDVVYGTVLRSTIYDTTTNTISSFDKQYLVPQGEYVPFVYQLVITLLPLKSETKAAIGGTSYRSGIKSKNVEVPTGTPAVLFCFESVTPWGAHEALRNRADVPFIAHVVSHGWFQTTPVQLWHQLDLMLTVQAVSSGLPIVQSSNAAPAKVYYPDGTIFYPPLQPVVPGVAISLINI